MEAETLGLHVGDELTYMVAGAVLSGRITSLRKLDWDSMRVNFFVITPPGVLDSYPVSYITSFHLPAGKEGVVTELVRVLPNLTLIDIATVVRQLQESFDQVARAVQALFGLALAAGLAVLGAAMQASSDERRRELAIMRALGGRGRQLRTALLAEFAALGLMAGALAGLGAAVIGWTLARFVFHLPYTPGPLLAVAGMTAGSVVVATFGMWATRGILARPLGGNALGV
jgi:putative ABC transport system permease protein